MTLLLSIVLIITLIFIGLYSWKPEWIPFLELPRKYPNGLAEGDVVYIPSEKRYYILKSGSKLPISNPENISAVKKNGDGIILDSLPTGAPITV